MTEVFALTAQPRKGSGTGEARALRRAGMVPAIVYGANKEPLPIAVTEKVITKHYRTPGFRSTIIEFEINKTKHKVLPQAVDLDPITDLVRHVDFVYLNNTVQKVRMPITFEGKDKSIGIKRGGVFNIVRRHVTLSCPVNSIPKSIVIDVTNMMIGQSLKAINIQLPPGCTLIEKPNLIIASIIGRGEKGDVAQPGQTPADTKSSTSSAATSAKAK